MLKIMSMPLNGGNKPHTKDTLTHNAGWEPSYVLGHVSQDYDKTCYAQAMVWWQKAAEQGHAEAQHHLGHVYCNGQGIAQDYEQAIDWYRKAAEQGNMIAQSVLLGCACYTGIGGEQNDAQAIEWWQLAAEQGNVLAQVFLGYTYYKGQRVARDYDQAIKWWQQAAWK
jgi:hypothetical protein